MALSLIEHTHTTWECPVCGQVFRDKDKALEHEKLCKNVRVDSIELTFTESYGYFTVYESRRSSWKEALYKVHIYDEDVQGDSSYARRWVVEVFPGEYDRAVQLLLEAVNKDFGERLNKACETLVKYKEERNEKRKHQENT